jgi:VanZ family protein
MSRLYSYSVLFAWMLIIFLFSSEPAAVSSLRSAVIVEVVKVISGGAFSDILTFLARKSAHIFLYSVLGILMYIVIRTYDLHIKKVIVAAVLLVFLYAVSDEVHQTNIPGRSGEVRDVLIDTAAGSLGIGVAYTALRKPGKKSLRKFSSSSIKPL